MSGSTSLLRASIVDAISDIRTSWATRESIDVHEFMLDVVAFRNFDIFESLNVLLDRELIAVAEILLRPLLEGTVLLEWCLNDPSRPNQRVLRFRRTCFEETLELVESGYLKRQPEYVDELKQSVCWCDENHIKRLPPVAQMLQESTLLRAELSNPTWRYFSKLLHGRFENWHDFARLTGDTGTRNAHLGNSRRVKECSALADYLILETMRLIGQFDPALNHGGLAQIAALWSATYKGANGSSPE
jgi:hypothetical protein